jgi:uncharacterized protein (DUF302 family)
MKNLYVVAAIGLVIGILVTGLLVYTMAPRVMMLESESKYGFDQTVEAFIAEVENAGWKVVGQHDMKSTLANFGHDILEVKIIEVCSAKYSAAILKLDDERIVSPLIPCRIAIYEKSDGKTYIGRMNSPLFGRMFGGVISDVIDQASIITEQMIQKIVK